MWYFTAHLILKVKLRLGKNESSFFIQIFPPCRRIQPCGSSVEECKKAGFREFMSYSSSEDKYFNHPILIFKYCTHLDSENFLETRVGLIPILDKVTLSLRINGKDSHRLWTHSSVKINHNEPFSTISLNYKGDYVTECTLVPKSIAREKGFVLSYDHTYDQKITQCQ